MRRLALTQRGAAPVRCDAPVPSGPGASLSPRAQGATLSEHDGVEPTEDVATEDLEVPEGEELHAFWEVARARLGTSGVEVVTGVPVSATVPPPSWAFGDNPQLADELLDLVLAGRKTATTSSVAELAEAAEPVPAVGDLSILLDGSGSPRALIRTTDVRQVRFDEVDAEYAALEGEGDLSLESWRADHERYWRRVLGPQVEDSGIGALELVLERFELLHPTPHADDADPTPRADDAG